MLARRGHKVLSARSGTEGLSLFDQFVPPLVLTEMLMPAPDGIECLIQIKRKKTGSKIVAMSGGSGALRMEYVLHLATRLGADCVLPKPFTSRQLSAAIEIALAHEPRGPNWSAL